METGFSRPRLRVACEEAGGVHGSLQGVLTRWRHRGTRVCGEAGHVERAPR